MATITLRDSTGRISSQVNTGLFIANEFVPARNGETLDLVNPATGEHLATVSAAQVADVDAAVAASKKAYETSWKRTSSAQRGQLLYALGELMIRAADEFAFLVTVDSGVLFSEAKNMHVPQAVETLRYFAGWADKMTGKSLDVPNGAAYTVREPLGVCAAIIPWNTPIMITAWKLAAAIAAGNTLIIKSPELCPLYGQKLGALIVEAGFPPGVINILCGEGARAGQAITRHMDIKKVAFTGSTLVGREVLKSSAGSNLKRVTLELGGKGPSIIFGDADLENALFWTRMGITMHNGQICAAGSRIYVHSSIYEYFLERFGKAMNDSAHGNPMLASTSKGPIINSKQHSKILDYIGKGKSSGARLICGGDSLGNNFVANTVFADVDEGDAIMKEEIFGPVASIAKFDTEAEVIAKANNTEYGLAAAVFTNDVSRAHRVSAAIESGQVTVNCWGSLHPNTPFGGFKQSGFGRDMGEDALEGWTGVKLVKINFLDSSETKTSKI